MELSFRRKVRGDSQTCFQNAQQLGETEKQANKRRRTGKHDSPAPSRSRFHKTRREEGGGKTKPVPSTSPGNVAAGRGRARGVLRVVPVVATQRRISPGQDVRVRGLGSSAPRPPYDLPGCPGNPADLKRKNERASAVFFISLSRSLPLSLYVFGGSESGRGPKHGPQRAGGLAGGRAAGRRRQRPEKVNSLCPLPGIEPQAWPPVQCARRWTLHQQIAGPLATRSFSLAVYLRERVALGVSL